MTEYIIVSTAVTDDIFQANLDYAGSYLGGAGIYALAGISLWTPNAMLLTGVGADFFGCNARWFESNRLTTDGIYEAAPLTPRTNVLYFPDGERLETPCFGAAHYAKMEPSADLILQQCKNVKGVYIFKDANPAFWRTLLNGKQQYGFTIEWEINADSAKPEYLVAVRDIAEQCDFFSINLREACSLLQANDLQAAISILTNWHTPMIFLRNGSSGSVMICKGKTSNIPSIASYPVIDPTGAGNASSAAVLYGYCEGFSPYDCGILGSISASHAIAQWGPPPDICQSRIDAHKQFQMLYNHTRERQIY